jgi:hypothetical protein
MDNLTKAAIIYRGAEETLEQAKARLKSYTIALMWVLELGAFVFDLGYKYDGIASPEMIAEFRASRFGNSLLWSDRADRADPGFWERNAQFWMSNYRFHRERM